MHIRFLKTVVSKRKPRESQEDTELLSSLDDTLKNTASQSSDTDAAPVSVATSSHSIFSASAGETLQPITRSKRRRLNNDEKSDNKTTVNLRPLSHSLATQPLIDFVKEQIDHMPLMDRDVEKEFVYRLAYRLAAAYLDDGVKAVIFAEVRPMKRKPRTSGEAAHMAKKHVLRVNQMQQVAKFHADALLMEALCAAATLGYGRAIQEKQRHLTKRPATIFPAENALLTGEPDSFYPGLLDVIYNTAVNLDQNFSGRAAAIVNKIIPILDKHIIHFKSRLPSTSSSLRLGA